MRDPILVTGASGFLGYYASERWAKQGLRVRGLTRSPESRIAPGVERRIAQDLVMDGGELRAALEGVHTVVHLAARVHVLDDRSRNPLKAYRHVNVQGTARLLEMARAAGARGFIYASSIMAMAESSDEVLSELSEPAPAGPYGISKLEAEEAVATESRSRFRTAAFRFPAMYGPRMKANMLRLFKAVAMGVPLPFGRVQNRRSLLHVENAFVAMDRILDCQTENHAVYVISDGEDVSTPRLVTEMARALGRSPRLLDVSTGALRTLGKAGDVISHLRPLPVTSEAILRLTGSLFVDPTNLWSRLTCSPPVSLREGLVATAQWYREEKRA